MITTEIGLVFDYVPTELQVKVRESQHAEQVFGGDIPAGLMTEIRGLQRAENQNTYVRQTAASIGRCCIYNVCNTLMHCCHS